MRGQFVVFVLVLLAGALVNIAVALSCARWASPKMSGWGNFVQADESWAIDVQSSFGFDVFGLSSRAKVAGGFAGLKERRLPGWASVPRYAPDMPRQMVYVAAGWPLRSLSAHTAPQVGPNTDPMLHPFGPWQGAALVPRPKGWYGGRYVIPRRALLRGSILNSALYAIIVWLVVVGPFVLRRQLRIKRGLCPKCAYPMGESLVCTECGRPLPVRPAVERSAPSGMSSRSGATRGSPSRCQTRFTLCAPLCTL